MTHTPFALRQRLTSTMSDGALPMTRSVSFSTFLLYLSRCVKGVRHAHTKRPIKTWRTHMKLKQMVMFAIAFFPALFGVFAVLRELFMAGVRCGSGGEPKARLIPKSAPVAPAGGAPKRAAASGGGAKGSSPPAKAAAASPPPKARSPPEKSRKPAPTPPSKGQAPPGKSLGGKGKKEKVRV